MAANANTHPLHHFRSFEQQREASELGMWVFLVTEILFFGGLLCGYIVYRMQHPEAWMAGSDLNSMWLGAGMTVVLLLSSLTVALAVRAAQLGSNRGVVLFLIATIVLGLIFIGMKAYEYHDHWVHHLVPGIDFSGYMGPNPHMVEMFTIFYFSLTLLHAAHMVIGVGLLAFIAWMAHRRKFSSDYYSPVEVTGLYWHFVDIVWLFLFPLLYLVGAHQ